MGSAPIFDSVNLNEDSEGKDYTEANPYVYKNISAKADSAMRPHTTDKSNKQSITDVYSDGFGPNDLSEDKESRANLVTANSNGPA